MALYIFIAPKFVSAAALSDADCDATLSAVSFLERPRVDGLTPYPRVPGRAPVAYEEKPTMKLRPEQQSQLVARSFLDDRVK